MLKGFYGAAGSQPALLLIISHAQLAAMPCIARSWTI